MDVKTAGGRTTPAAKGRAVLLTVVEAALQVLLPEPLSHDYVKPPRDPELRSSALHPSVLAWSAAIGSCRGPCGRCPQLKRYTYLLSSARSISSCPLCGGLVTPGAVMSVKDCSMCTGAQAAEKPLVLLLPTAASLFAIKELSGLLDLAVNVHRANLGRLLCAQLPTP